MVDSASFSVILLLVVSAALVISGFRKQPGVGIIVALLVAGLVAWLRGDGLNTLGLGAPDSWLSTILLGLLCGFLIQLLAVVVLEPISERVTGKPHDHSILDNVRGDWLVLVQWLVVVWVLVALIEEIIFRGFLMNEFSRILGDDLWATALNITLTALIFGLAHWYQGPGGALSTGIVGILLGGLFIWNGKNLWMLIFTHGFIDTIGIALISINGDKYLRRMLWGKET